MVVEGSRGWKGVWSHHRLYELRETQMRLAVASFTGCVVGSVRFRSLETLSVEFLVVVPMERVLHGY